MIRPKKEDFLKLARPDHLLPIVLEMSSDVINPVDAFYATRASYLLESAEKGMQVGRYSFLGVEPQTRLEIRGENCLVEENGERKAYMAKDPLRMVGELLRARPYISQGDLSPFPGGAVGYVGYDMVRRWEDIPRRRDKADLGLPDAVFLYTRFTIVFDNLMHSLKIICNQPVSDDPAADYEQAVQDLEKLSRRLSRADEYRPRDQAVNSSGRMTSSFPRKKFEAKVAEIREMLAAGEAIQVVLSQRLETPFEDDPFAVYRALRSINPSPYMFFLDFGSFSLFGASPEVMVRVEDGRAVLRPIAGTRPRGQTAEEDEANREALLADPKERAEHLMLVDLGRNDLGRIAKAGTVHVDRFMEVERYSHVMHLVSEVTAELGERVDVFDVIRATFPAGTVSGAPKVRAMEIIEDMEPVRRGPYAGMVGYLGYTGQFDSCITIRSILAANKRLYLQAGAGIVYDSDPSREYEETLNKARAMFRALRKGSRPAGEGQTSNHAPGEESKESKEDNVSNVSNVNNAGTRDNEDNKDNRDNKSSEGGPNGFAD